MRRGPAVSSSADVTRVPGAAKASRAGRNLPAAIGVGLPLFVVAVVGMLWLPWLVFALALVASCIGTWEVARAMRARNISVPMVPLQCGALCIGAGTWFFGTPGLSIGLFIAALVVAFYRVFVPERDILRPLVASVFILLWVPFLIAFALLLLKEAHGGLKLATMVALVVANDTFGYIVGVLFGKHPMVPAISPKKSWEGFSGSLLGACVIGVLACVFLLHVPWWVGIVFAVLIVFAATTGDLAESMIKRELGIKDMSNILPGHGGVMDRLDSIVFAIPATYLVSLLINALG